MANPENITTVQNIINSIYWQIKEYYFKIITKLETIIDKLSTCEWVCIHSDLVIAWMNVFISTTTFHIVQKCLRLYYCSTSNTSGMQPTNGVSLPQIRWSHLLIQYNFLNTFKKDDTHTHRERERKKESSQ